MGTNVNLLLDVRWLNVAISALILYFVVRMFGWRLRSHDLLTWATVLGALAVGIVNCLGGPERHMYGWKTMGVLLVLMVVGRLWERDWSPQRYPRREHKDSTGQTERR